ncbi:FRG domain-containing protein [uncultured Roseobacter sp.]|uniref:FRG domain-containing protein n=1 Tax=uncultured Roseobacter sp. TaxID=114847 RepID=UPI002639FCD6|nr:FRG domain-containing protein [uncultured Roseobacter sp.]
MRAMERLTLPRLAGLDDLFTLFREKSSSRDMLFRGQSDADWELVPSLYRQGIGGINVGRGPRHNERAYDAVEKRISNRFFSEGYPFLTTIERSTRNDLAIMQHFGCPTRLLDWSRDPLVALYFALYSSKENTDAALYLISPTGQIGTTIDGPYPAGLPHRGRLMMIAPSTIDRRVIAQKSMFTIQSFGENELEFTPLDRREILRETPVNPTDPHEQTTAFVKFIIPNGRKWYLMDRLLSMGVNHATLFPGLEGIGSSIAHAVRHRHLV